jgi:transposase-like protein
MRIFALCLLIPALAMAAESDIANRNLGVNARQVAKVKQAEAVRKGEAPAPTKSARTDTPANASEIRREKIDVYASQIEELSGPEKAALQKFADRLETDRPLTPAEKAQLFLSFFLGGPPPAKEPTPEERTQARVARGGTMLANPRGTLQ